MGGSSADSLRQFHVHAERIPPFDRSCFPLSPELPRVMMHRIIGSCSASRLDPFSRCRLLANGLQSLLAARSAGLNEPGGTGKELRRA